MKAFLVSTIFIAFCAGCGGGGDSGLGTVWVETDVLVADIDGDGRADVLTLAMSSEGYGTEEGHLKVYRQTSTPGVFATPVTYAVGKYPWRVKVANIDNDDKPDLVITDPEAETTWLMLQDAAYPGQFSTPVPLISGVSNYDAVIADLNNDGAPDVAVGDNMLVVRYQDPITRGSFGPYVEVTLPGRSSVLATGDIDGDGLFDVLTWLYTNPIGTYPPTAALVVMYQKPGGGFEISGFLAQKTGLNAGRLAIDDVNADGHPDLFAFLTPFSSSYTTQLVVVPQTVIARSFGVPVYTSLSGVRGNDDAVLADLNHDNLPDTTLVGFWPESGGPLAYPDIKSAATFLTNTGQGMFESSSAISMPFPVSVLSAGDLNGDDRNDIVLLGSDNQCLVMFQTSTGTFLTPQAI